MRLSWNELNEYQRVPWFRCEVFLRHFSRRKNVERETFAVSREHFSIAIPRSD